MVARKCAGGEKSAGTKKSQKKEENIPE